MLTHAHDRMPFGSTLHEDGCAFRLWAPARDGVQVVVDGTPHALQAVREGWFAASVAGVRAGARYGFRFAGEDLIVPDPASRFQPDGAGGRSEVIDPQAYRWRTEGWRGRPWHETVLYELHVGTFTPEGTYAAAAERLGTLADLGITAVELMPLSQPAGERNWGYDGVLPFAPQSAYGRPDDLKAFVDAAHERGLSVFLDVVYNHFGPEANYLHAYAPGFFTERHHTPWGAALNVDGEQSAYVREFFIQNAIFWLTEYRFDGLRLDAVHEIRDDSPRPFLRELAERAKGAVAAFRHVHLVAENDLNATSLLDVYDAQWNDDAHHAFHVLLTGEREGYYGDYAQTPARLLGRALAEGFAYQGEPSQHRGGVARGERSSGLPPTAFVDFLQNHDQIGNRALGERLAALVPQPALHAAAATLLLAPAIPLVFMGEEWAASTPFLFFSSFGPELASAVTEGRRREFAAWSAFADPATRAKIPDPQDPATRDASRLRWEEREREPHRATLALYTELLALRAGVIVPLLARGLAGEGYEVLGPATLRVRWRTPAGERLGLVANLGAAPERVSYALDGARIYTVGNVPARAEDSELPAWSVGWFLAS